MCMSIMQWGDTTHCHMHDIGYYTPNYTLPFTLNITFHHTQKEVFGMADSRLISEYECGFTQLNAWMEAHVADGASALDASSHGPSQRI